MNNKDALPTTDPSSGATDHSARPKTFCIWLVAVHDMREAGESRWAPWGALFATRLFSGLTCIALVILMAIRFQWMLSIHSLAGLIFSGLTYLGLAACTLLHGTGAQASQKSGFSTAVVFLHSITAALSVLLILEFAGIADDYQHGGFNPDSLIVLTPFIAYLLDVLVMQARIRLRYRYSVFFFLLSTVCTIVWIVILAVRCVNCFLFPLVGLLVGINMGIGLIASLIAVSLTRISLLCLKN